MTGGIPGDTGGLSGFSETDLAEVGAAFDEVINDETWRMTGEILAMTSIAIPVEARGHARNYVLRCCPPAYQAWVLSALDLVEDVSE